MIPRGNLPPIDFTNKNPVDVISDAVNLFEKISNESLAAADPRRVFIQSLCSIIVQQRVIIDYAGKQNLLSYSEKDFLDHLGYYVKTERLEAQSSVTTEQFMLTAPQPSVYVVPAGSQVTDGNFVFETMTVLQIPIGQTTGLVTVQAVDAGKQSNGLMPGQINTLVTALPYIKSVSNISVTAGGADIEDDDNYAERIHLAPERYSVAGPTGAYEYWARSANQAIKDVGIETPTAGTVEVRVLLEGGELPTQEILDQVSMVLSPDGVRPFTDNVLTLAPDVSEYELNVEYWISNDDLNLSVTIQDAVNKAVEEYRVWQRTKIGRDINPDELIARMKNAGAKRVSISSPVFTVVSSTEVAQENSVSIVFNGGEDA